LKNQLYFGQVLSKTKVIIKMVTYAVNADGLPIYDATGRNLIEMGGHVYDIDGRRTHHFSARGDPMTGGAADLAGLADVPQPPLMD